MCVLFCAYTMYLQICQVYNPNTSNTFTIANENEQILTDPSDSRGQMYLSYRGPGEPQSGVAGPRCVRYTRNYIYMYSIQNKCECGLLYYNICTSSFNRNTRVYLHCNQSQTTPVATAIGEPEGILNYVSCKRCCTSYHLR